MLDLVSTSNIKVIFMKKKISLICALKLYSFISSILSMFYIIKVNNKSLASMHFLLHLYTLFFFGRNQLLHGSILALSFFQCSFAIACGQLCLLKQFWNFKAGRFILVVDCCN